jgi:hypothetical protein
MTLAPCWTRFGYFVLRGERDACPLPHTPILAATILARGRFPLTIPISFGNIEVPASLRFDA